jgi:hypothetical protein
MIRSGTNVTSYKKSSRKSKTYADFIFQDCDSHKNERDALLSSYMHQLGPKNLESANQSSAGFSGREARRHPRFRFETDIRINSKTSGILSGRSVDLSESGISAMLKIEVPVGEMVELQFKLPNGPMTVYAIVRQRSAFRYGFQFIESPESRATIQTACEILAARQP